MAKPDLNKLRTEIDTRKKEKGILGETMQGTTIPAKDVFLNSLLTSLHTGQNTPVVNNIKTMNERADIISGAVKSGVVTPEAINKIKELKNSTNYVAPAAPQHNQPPQYVQPGRINEADMGMGPERDDAIFSDFQRKFRSVGVAGNNGTLAESIEGFNNNRAMAANQLYNAKGQPVNPDGSLLNPPAVSFGNNGMPMINEGYLTESVKRTVNNYLMENFGPIVEEAIKSTILEMYAVERIKEVLTENKEMIKSVVYETIRELQNKNKNKGQ
jgi:hypothetical protein